MEAARDAKHEELLTVKADVATKVAAAEKEGFAKALRNEADLVAARAAQAAQEVQPVDPCTWHECRQKECVSAMDVGDRLGSSGCGIWPPQPPWLDMSAHRNSGWGLYGSKRAFLHCGAGRGNTFSCWQWSVGVGGWAANNCTPCRFCCMTAEASTSWRGHQ
jgi:hypothetical protein